MRIHRLLYDWLVKQGQDPLIIDAQDLLNDPLTVRVHRRGIEAASLIVIPFQVMGIFCKDAGVEFDKSMCSWEGGQVQEHFAVSRTVCKTRLRH